MTTFSEYEKMPTSLKKLGLTEKDLSLMEKLKWVVTEKVHGANFSISFDKQQLQYAKRKDYLKWEDDFFAFQLAVAEIEDAIIRLFESLSHNLEADKYIVYGELFGGSYPHPDVIPDKNVQAIQTGIYYAPTIHFYAFDIAIVKQNKKLYLDYETAIAYFLKFGILHAKPLFIGKLNEALNYNIRINTTIPKQLNLPELCDNIIEGIVIKPYNQTNQDSITTRPILKIKNPEFEEQNQFHEARKWSFQSTVISKSEQLSFIVEDLRNYITTNRLQNAISKIGAPDATNKQRMTDIETEFTQDILATFNEDNNNLLNELSEEQNQWIQERIKYEITRTISTQNK